MRAAELLERSPYRVADGRLQEAESGGVVRVSTLKRLKEAKKASTYLNSRMYEAVSRLEESFLREDFDWSLLEEMACEDYIALGEATASTAQGQLLRAGVQVIANDWYLRTPVSWMNYVQETSSNKRQEFHAPLFRSGLPKEVRPQEPYSEQRIVGLDRELVNRKFMGGESFERELFDDDQTGQIRNRAQSLGEAQRILEEIYVAGKILGLTGFSVADYTVPTSNFSTVNANGTTITTPYSTNLYKTGSGNTFSTFLPLSFSSLKKAKAQLLNALDPNGIKILVKPNVLVVSVQDEINAATLLNSQFYPAVQGPATTTASTAVGGGIGTNFATNVFKGMFDLQLNYFFPDWAWTIGEAKKGPMFQRRDPMEVVQEVPNSGQSFDLDSIRFRSRARWEMDWIDSRFWFLGDDGSVAGAQ